MEEINVVVDQKNGVIGFNFDEIKNILDSEMAVYRGMVFTEESKTEAKKTVAELRKLKKAVDDKRKEVKSSFMQPYTDFESKVKELYALIDEPISFISGQIEDFERKRVEERKAMIQQIYDENISGMNEYLPLNRIYNDKWENSTTSKKSIMDEIVCRVDTVKKDLETIRSIGTEFEDKAIDSYKASLSLADAIQTVHSYEKQKEEILARQKEQKEKAENAIQENVLKPDSTNKDVKKEDFTIPEEQKNPVVRYEIEADPFQIAQIEAAMRELDIKYRRLQ